MAGVGRGAADAAPPCPGVAFGPDFTRRLERFVLRVASARERREGSGRAALGGSGEEFIGFRPYRSGEDLRALDWSLFARLDQPYVRVTRREASERWTLFVDTSASMGVGPPGKLQSAAEVTCALACLGLRMGARVQVVPSHASGSRGEIVVRRKPDLPGLLNFCESQRAQGARGLAGLIAERRPPAEAGRVFLIGDLFDLQASDVLGLTRRGRELFCVQILAPIEFTPPALGSVEWKDPEGEGRLALEVDEAQAAAYERELHERLESWRLLAARHRFGHGSFSSDTPFEDVVRTLLGA